MSSEEQQITMNKPEKNPRRVAAGKNLANYNKAARKIKELGEMSEESARPESNCKNDDDDEEMGSTTKVLMLAGVAGLAYYLYTTTSDSKKEEVVKRESNGQSNNNVQNNNEVQENTVNRLRSFKT